MWYCRRNALVSSVRTGSDRFEQELIGRPLWSTIYRELWGRDIDIEYGLGENYECLAVDVCIRKTDVEFPLYGQEKTLSYHYGTKRGFDTLTIERQQKPGEQGDAFRLAAQFYACAYLNEDETAFTHGGIVYWPVLVEARWLGAARPWLTNWNQDGHAQAQLIYIHYKDIPQDCLIWHKDRRTGRVVIRPGQQQVYSQVSLGL